MKNYSYDSSLFSEQLNTLVMLDTIIGKANLDYTPVFELLGGTAIAFHGIQSVFTIDIDCANRLSEEVKSLVEPFISDAASEVVNLPKNYKMRLIPFATDKLSNITVCLLSAEDIIITKLGAFRSKDVDDMVRSGIWDKADYRRIVDIIKSEYDLKYANRLLMNLQTVRERRELYEIEKGISTGNW